MPRKRKRGKLAKQRESNFRALFRSYQYRARRKKLAFELTSARFRELVTSPCFICGSHPSQLYRHERGMRDAPFVYNGVDRMNNAEGYIEGNVAPCCGTCNEAKMDRSLEDFLLYIYRAYRHAVLPAFSEGVTHDESDSTDDAVDA